jgi:hypothetical protein
LSTKADLHATAYGKVAARAEPVGAKKEANRLTEREACCRPPQRVAWLSEPRLRVATNQMGPTVATAGLHIRRSLATTADEPIDVAPDEMTVRAVVEMGVEAIDPDTAG